MNLSTEILSDTCIHICKVMPAEWSKNYFSFFYYISRRQQQPLGLNMEITQTNWRVQRMIIIG